MESCARGPRQPVHARHRRGGVVKVCRATRQRRRKVGAAYMKVRISREPRPVVEVVIESIFTRGAASPCSANHRLRETSKPGPVVGHPVVRVQQQSQQSARRKPPFCRRWRAARVNRRQQVLSAIACQCSSIMLVRNVFDRQNSPFSMCTADWLLSRLARCAGGSAPIGSHESMRVRGPKLICFEPRTYSGGV